MSKHLKVYYSGQADDVTNDQFIEVWCSDWQDTHWEVSLELTGMRPSERNDIVDNITPGATSNQFTILGEKHFIDSTYASGNTLILDPVDGTGLGTMHSTTTIAVKSWSDEFINHKVLNAKLTGVILD